MSLMASWNGMSWECSPKEITWLEGLSTSFEIETNTNADKSGKSPTEMVGMKEIPVSFSTTYRVETGTRDIKKKISEWRALIGKAAPLIIGNEIFGPNKLQLTKVVISNIKMRPNGLFTAATLSFSFKEYIGIKNTTKSSGSKSSKNGFNYEEFKSGLNVGASKEDKKSKNTVKRDAILDQINQDMKNR